MSSRDAVPDPLAQFLRGKTVRRVIALGSFCAIIVVFRQLAPLVVFFLAFSHALAGGSRWLVRHARIGHKAAVLILVGAILALLGGGIALGVG